LLRAYYKEIQMGYSSLEMVIRTDELARKIGRDLVFTDSLFDTVAYASRFKKGPDYLPGPVTVIKFDYLQQQ
jgi:hypothetical protein